MKINRGRKKPKTLTQIRLGNLLTRRYKVNEDDRSVNFGDLSKCFPVVKNEMKNKKKCLSSELFRLTERSIIFRVQGLTYANEKETKYLWGS